MTNLEQKCVAALAAHEKALQAVKAMTRRIGDAIARCPVSVEIAQSWKTGANVAHLTDEKGKDKTHLWQALTKRVGCDSGYGVRALDAEEINDELHDPECPHCIEAWELIQQRKDARQQLGIQRRLIRYYGKRAMEAQEASQ